MTEVETKRTLTVADMNVSEWPNWESIVIRKPLLTLMLAMIAPGSVGRNAAQAEGLAGDATLSEEMLNTPGCMRSISPVLSKVQTFRQRGIASGAKAIFAAFALFAASTRSARAEDAGSSFLTQPSLTDTPDGPKEQLRSIGIMPDFWVTQFYQGQTEGDGSKTWRYGGKLDAFLKVDAEKLGLWPGFHVNVQYEHYIGQNINRTDFALIPVNTALAYVERDGYHSALSVSVTQDLGEYIAVSAGKFDMMTLASPVDRRRRHRHFHEQGFRPAIDRGGLHSSQRRGRRQGCPLGALSYRRNSDD